MTDEAREAAWRQHCLDMAEGRAWPTTAAAFEVGFAAGFAAGVVEGLRQAPFTREVLVAFYQIAYEESSEGTLRFLASRYSDLFGEEIDDALPRD